MLTVARVATKVTRSPVRVQLGQVLKLKLRNFSRYLPCSTGTRVTIVRTLVHCTR